MSYWEGLLHGSAGAIVYGIIAILLAAFGFKVFDWLCPRIDFEKEISEKQNIAVAILAAAIVLGVCFIMSRAIN